MGDVPYTLIIEYDDLCFNLLDSMIPSSQYCCRMYMKNCTNNIYPFKMSILWI